MNNCRIAFRDEATGAITTEDFSDPYLFVTNHNHLCRSNWHVAFRIDPANPRTTTWGGIAIIQNCEYRP